MDDSWHSLASLLANAPKLTYIDVSHQRGTKIICTEVEYAKKGRGNGKAKVTMRDSQAVVAEIVTKKLEETHPI